MGYVHQGSSSILLSRGTPHRVDTNGVDTDGLSCRWERLGLKRWTRIRTHGGTHHGSGNEYVL